MNQVLRKKLSGTPIIFKVKWLRDSELKG